MGTARYKLISFMPKSYDKARYTKCQIWLQKKLMVTKVIDEISSPTRCVRLQCSCNSFPFLPSFLLLPHLVLVALAHLAELPAELDVDLEVEVALVPLVWLHREVAAQLLALEKPI